MPRKFLIDSDTIKNIITDDDKVEFMNNLAHHLKGEHYDCPGHIMLALADVLLAQITNEAPEAPLYPDPTTKMEARRLNKLRKGYFPGTGLDHRYNDLVWNHLFSLPLDYCHELQKDCRNRLSTEKPGRYRIFLFYMDQVLTHYLPYHPGV